MHRDTFRHRYKQATEILDHSLEDPDTRLACTSRSSCARCSRGPVFCGALTTFSTFQEETIALAGDGSTTLAAGYAAASLAAGMLVAVAATVVARRRRYG